MKHHYVPQFLLRRWANEAGKLFVFAIRDGRVVCKDRSPEYTGYENRLYAIIANAFGLSEDILERKVFGRIDNDAAQVLQKLENHEALTEDEHVAWTFFLSSLRVRQPDVLYFLRTKGIALLRESLARRDKATLPAKASGTEQWFSRHFPGTLEASSLASWLPRMIAHANVLETFGSLRWWIQEFEPTAVKLLLADLPLHWEGGFQEDGFLIQLPIAPNRAFFGARSEQTEILLSQMPHADLIRRINLTTLASSVQRLWASTKDEAHQFIEANLDKLGKNGVEFGSLVAAQAPDAVDGDPGPGVGDDSATV